MSYNIEDSNPLAPAAKALQDLTNQAVTDSQMIIDLGKQVEQLTISPREKKVNELLAVGLSWGACLKIPYIFAAEYENNQAFDCSAFTQKLFGYYGYPLPRTSYSQLTVGTEISFDQVQKGDLIFFKYHVSGPHASDHVGIIYSVEKDVITMLHTNQPDNPDPKLNTIHIAALRPVDKSRMVGIKRIIT